MAVTAMAADNTLGTWKYNPAKSKQATGASPIASLTVTREATNGTVKISAKGERKDGSKIETVTTTKYDGAAANVAGTGLTWDSTTIKQINENTLVEERSKEGGKYRSTVHTVVSKDGKTMTSSAQGTDPEGKPFTSVAVFNKQ
jgi:hypothetical protein